MVEKQSRRPGDRHRKNKTVQLARGRGYTTHIFRHCFGFHCRLNTSYILHCKFFASNVVIFHYRRHISLPSSSVAVTSLCLIHPSHLHFPFFSASLFTLFSSSQFFSFTLFSSKCATLPILSTPLLPSLFPLFPYSHFISKVHVVTFVC